MDAQTMIFMVISAIVRMVCVYLFFSIMITTGCAVFSEKIEPDESLNFMTAVKFSSTVAAIFFLFHWILPT